MAPVSIVMSKAAKTLPWNSEYYPIVAELATCHQTLEALAPLTSRMRVCAPGLGAPSAVVRVLASHPDLLVPFGGAIALRQLATTGRSASCRPSAHLDHMHAAALHAATEQVAGH